MVFTAKKVEEIPSFSEKLRKSREELGLSKEKAGQLLNFPARYFDYLEKGELDKLPADVYSKGFLRKYAKILDIEPDLLVLEFEKEIKIIRHLDKGFNEHLSLPSLRVSRWIITPKTLGAGLGAVLFLRGDEDTWLCAGGSSSPSSYSRVQRHGRCARPNCSARGFNSLLLRCTRTVVSTSMGSRPRSNSSGAFAKSCIRSSWSPTIRP